MRGAAISGSAVATGSGLIVKVIKKGPAPATQGLAPYCWQQQDYGGLRGSFKVCVIPAVRGLPGATLRYAENSPVSLS